MKLSQFLLVSCLLLLSLVSAKKQHHHHEQQHRHRLHQRTSHHHSTPVVTEWDPDTVWFDLDQGSTQVFYSVDTASQWNVRRYHFCKHFNTQEGSTEQAVQLALDGVSKFLEIGSLVIDHGTGSLAKPISSAMKMFKSAFTHYHQTKNYPKFQTLISSAASSPVWNIISTVASGITFVLRAAATTNNACIACLITSPDEVLKDWYEGKIANRREKVCGHKFSMEDIITKRDRMTVDDGLAAYYTDKEVTRFRMAFVSVYQDSWQNIVFEIAQLIESLYQQLQTMVGDVTSIASTFESALAEKIEPFQAIISLSKDGSKLLGKITKFIKTIIEKLTKKETWTVIPVVASTTDPRDFTSGIFPEVPEFDAFIESTAPYSYIAENYWCFADFGPKPQLRPDTTLGDRLVADLNWPAPGPLWYDRAQIRKYGVELINHLLSTTGVLGAQIITGIFAVGDAISRGLGSKSMTDIFSSAEYKKKLTQFRHEIAHFIFTYATQQKMHNQALAIQNGRETIPVGTPDYDVNKQLHKKYNYYAWAQCHKYSTPRMVGATVYSFYNLFRSLMETEKITAITRPSTQLVTTRYGVVFTGDGLTVGPNQAKDKEGHFEVMAAKWTAEDLDVNMMPDIERQIKTQEAIEKRARAAARMRISAAVAAASSGKTDSTDIPEGFGGILCSKHNCDPTDNKMTTSIYTDAKVSVPAFKGFRVLGYLRVPALASYYALRLRYKQKAILTFGNSKIGHLELKNAAVCDATYDTYSTKYYKLESGKYYEFNLQYQSGCGGGEFEIILCHHITGCSRLPSSYITPALPAGQTATQPELVVPPPSLGSPASRHGLLGERWIDSHRFGGVSKPFQLYESFDYSLKDPQSISVEGYVKIPATDEYALQVRYNQRGKFVFGSEEVGGLDMSNPFTLVLADKTYATKKTDFKSYTVGTFVKLAIEYRSGLKQTGEFELRICRQSLAQCWPLSPSLVYTSRT